jgi:cytochrome c556
VLRDAQISKLLARRVNGLIQAEIRKISTLAGSAAARGVPTLRTSSMNRLVSLALATACVALSVPASAQFAKSEDAVKYRESALFVMSQHFGRLGAMANGRVPYDAAAATANAEIVAEMAKLPWAGFGPGTEGGKARPEVWKEQAKFKENQERLMAETVKLVASAKAGNLDALKAQFGPTGEACKTCHDGFRAK